MIKISKRLSTIADQIEAGSRVADIGSDHALLPVYLSQAGKLVYGVAGEVNEGPYESARRQVRQAGLGHRIDVRLGDGLEVLQRGEVDTIVIAGMGGGLMTDILSASPAKLEGVKRLVLQPNVGEEQVRSWLSGKGWLLEQEVIMEEDGKIYEILTAVRSHSEGREDPIYAQPIHIAAGKEIPARLKYVMGPILLKQGSAIFIKKWQSELIKLERICQTIANSEQQAARDKEQAYRAQISEISEVVACLLTAKP